jgi:hypothetical protein
LGSLTGVYSRISSCPKKVGVTFGCTHLTAVERTSWGLARLQMLVVTKP